MSEPLEQGPAHQDHSVGATRGALHVVAAWRYAEQRGVPIDTGRAKELQHGKLAHLTGGRSPDGELPHFRVRPGWVVVE